ncbi:MAG: SEC-C metal-binding domain-containing protein, partial [Sulfurimonas sp.]
YRFRNQLLDNEYDVSSKIKEIREEFIAHILGSAGIYEGLPEEDYNLETLAELLKEEINTEIEIDSLKALEYEKLYEYILNGVATAYEEKMSVLDEKTRAEIERELYLRELDNAWRDHLYAMDGMKTGIRLRAYNQKDPLVEYKKEAYNLFTELTQSLKLNVVKTLQIIQFKMESAEEEAARFAEELAQRQKAQEEMMQFNLSDNDNEAVSAKKPARNEPCPCGSGKKYKQCCGKSGPKKGAFAS